MAKKYRELRDGMSPQRRARVDARIKAMPLSALRKLRNLTQHSVSGTMEISQGDVSKLEQRTDCYVSTLRNYAKAMGGELEMVVRFPDGEAVRINQFEEPE
jgi:transcriptional regulator with XRE-family HTH domain